MAWPLARQVVDVDQRRADRDAIGVPTLLRRCSPPVTAPMPATLANLSPLGFLVRIDIDIIDGAIVALTLPMLGEVRARAIWSMGRDLGAEFLSPIAPLHYDNVLAALERHREARQPERSSSTLASRSNR